MDPTPARARGPAVRPHLAIRRLRARRTPARAAGSGARPSRSKPSRSKSFARCLLHAGEVVTKGELLEAVWPGTAVVDGSLATAISKVRKLLGDDEKVIVTVPRVGYKLAAPVHCKATSRDCACGTASSPGQPRSGARSMAVDPAARLHPRRAMCGSRNIPRRVRRASSSLRPTACA